MSEIEFLMKKTRDIYYPRIKDLDVTSQVDKARARDLEIKDKNNLTLVRIGEQEEKILDIKNRIVDIDSGITILNGDLFGISERVVALEGMYIESSLVPELTASGIVTESSFFEAGMEAWNMFKASPQLYATADTLTVGEWVQFNPESTTVKVTEIQLQAELFDIGGPELEYALHSKSAMIQTSIDGINWIDVEEYDTLLDVNGLSTYRLTKDTGFVSNVRVVWTARHVEFDNVIVAIAWRGMKIIGFQK